MYTQDVVIMKIERLDSVYSKLVYDESETLLFKKLQKRLSIEDVTLKYTPAVKAGYMSSMVKYLSDEAIIGNGLLPKLKEEAFDLGIDLEIPSMIIDDNFIQLKKDSFTKYNLPFTPYDFQIRAVNKLLNNELGIIKSATGSGKSLMLFLTFMHLIENNPNEKILLVVPDINLVLQMYNDFIEYSKNYKDISNLIHKIYGGQNKDADVPIIISTWQSIAKLDDSHSIYQSVTSLYVDEVHLGKSKSYKSIITKLGNINRRMGVTGTVPTDVIPYYELTSLFGVYENIITAREMIDLNLSSNVVIAPYMLRYDDDAKRDLKAMQRGLKGTEKYRAEVDFVSSNKERLKTVCKVILQLSKKNDGNILVLFNTVAYGEAIYKVLSKYTDKVLFIGGKTKVKDRKEILANYDKELNGKILVSTFSISSKGLNLTTLQYLVLAQSSKSENGIPQAIGRILRRFPDGKKRTGVLLDFVDDLRHDKRNGGKVDNYLYKSYLERLQIFEHNEFETTFEKNIKLGSSLI